MPERWEYQIVKVMPNEKSERKLNELGADGWRVVQAVVRPDDPKMIAVILERSLPSSGRRV
jgi:hypothetical protein